MEIRNNTSIIPIITISLPVQIKSDSQSCFGCSLEQNSDETNTTCCGQLCQTVVYYFTSFINWVKSLFSVGTPETPPGVDDKDKVPEIPTILSSSVPSISDQILERKRTHSSFLSLARSVGTDVQRPIVIAPVPRRKLVREVISRPRSIPEGRKEEIVRIHSLDDDNKLYLVCFTPGRDFELEESFVHVCVRKERASWHIEKFDHRLDDTMQKKLILKVIQALKKTDIHLLYVPRSCQNIMPLCDGIVLRYFG